MNEYEVSIWATTRENLSSGFRQSILKLVSLATETSKKKEIALVASVDMVISKKRITKALIRLRKCAGLSAPLLFRDLRRQVFSRVEAHMLMGKLRT